MSVHERPIPLQTLRCLTPYVAFPRRDVGSPDNSTTTHKSNTEISQRAWEENAGYGSRHVMDTAPFTLWDMEKGDFRMPTSFEEAWIRKTYSASSVTYNWPELIIETSNPPSPVPLTVACVAVIFLPEGGIPPFLDTNTSYSNPRLLDPIPVHWHWPKWENSTQAQRQVIFEALDELVAIKAVNFIAPIIIVEIKADDGRTYGQRSLPGKIAGRMALYHHGEKPFWGLAKQGKERIIQPSDTTEDITNYQQACQTLCPGVRVESGVTARNGGYLDATMSSTAGALLRSSEGQRTTVSNHGFLESDEVFHPSSRHGGTCIGRITERFEALDIALVQLFPSANFTNNEYFEAEPPKRLLRHDQVPNNTWCTVDSMATGLVFLRTNGVRISFPPRPVGNNIKMHFAQFLTETIYRYIGPSGGQIKDGVCGSPIVVDDETGGVIGFFHLGERNSAWASCPCLDDLIDRGWSLV